MSADNDLDSLHKISIVLDALATGNLKIKNGDEEFAQRLLALPRGVTGLIDIKSLSREEIVKARAIALGLTFLRSEKREDSDPIDINIQDAQCELFRLFDEMFFGLTGAAVETVGSIDEIRARIVNRLRNDDGHYFDQFNEAAEELAELYRKYSSAIYAHAKSLGGVKVVAGGQKSFGSSALAATRIAGLYCDTQLIPDPVSPFFSGELHLNAKQLQLAIILYYILPLRPLVDARLAEPPVFIFPSFEEALEERDAVTQSGIASMLTRLVAPACGENLQSIEELFEFARKNEDAFLGAVTNEKLFVPPGVDPQHVGTAQESARIYLRELEGVRGTEYLDKLKRLPTGVLVLNGILERIRPHYHLLENASELDAQPLLSQKVHWHYFERCAEVEARELVRQNVISRESLDILRALQDDSLTWLANIPIKGLVELRQNLEHAELRERLSECTAQLTSAAPADLERVTKEVRHGLAVLIQRQQVAIREIEARYAPKKWQAAVGSAVGSIASAGMYFLPALAAITGVSAPVAGAIGGLAGGGLMLAKEWAGQAVEKRGNRKTLLGVLATAHSLSKK